MAAALSAEALLEPLVPSTTAHTEAATEAGAGADASASDVRVFLPDYQGCWAPLTHLFYSPTGRCLASAHPQATSEEIESYFCPSCLSYLAEAEAAAAGHRCPRCFDCPRCPPGGAAALAVVPAASAAAPGSASGAGGWELRCAFCGWGSAAALGLVEEDPEYLGMTLSVAERESSEEGRFQHFLGTLRRHAVERARERELSRLGLCLSSLAAPGKGKGQGGRQEGGTLDGAGGRWRLQDLERREAEAQQAAQGGYDPKRGAVLYSQLQQEQEKGGSSSSHISSAALTVEGEALPADFLALPSLEEVTRGEQRFGMCLHQPRSTRDLRPLRKPLLTKRSRRCLLDVQAGRPGILLKPKLNPLEGDSSLRAHVGKWWQKDASAVHTLPAAAVVAVRWAQAPPEEEGSCWASFLLRLSNPLPGRVRVGVVPEEEEEEQQAGQGPPPYYLRRLRGALVGAAADGAAAEAEATVILRAAAAMAAADTGAVCEAVLDGREDEYLEDEEDGVGGAGGGEGDPVELEARATRAFLEEDGTATATAVAPAVLLQSRHRAWLRVAVPAAEARAALAAGVGGGATAAAGVAVAVLVFLRLTGERGEFAALPSSSSSSSTGLTGAQAAPGPAAGGEDEGAIVVPLCLAFRHQAAAMGGLPAASETAAPRTRGQRRKQQGQGQGERPPADAKAFFEGLLTGEGAGGAGGAPASSAPAPAAAPKPAEAPAPAAAPAPSQSASAFFEGLLASSSAPAAAAAAPASRPTRRTRAQARQVEERPQQQGAEAEAQDGGSLAAALGGLGLGGGGDSQGSSSEPAAK